MVKKRMPEATPAKPEGHLVGGSEAKDYQIEQALLKEESVDSMYKKSAEKNMFEIARSETGSKNKQTLSRRSNLPGYGLGEDQAFERNDYDLNSMFQEVDRRLANRPASINLFESSRPTYNDDSREEDQEAKRLYEASSMLDQYAGRFEGQFLPKVVHRDEISLLNVNRTVLGDVSRGPNATGLDMSMHQMSYLQGYVDSGRKKNNRKVCFDESTYLPGRGLREAGVMDSSEEKQLEVDWSSYRFAGLLQEKDIELPSVEADYELSAVIKSVVNSTMKPSNSSLTRKGCCRSAD